MPDADGFFSPDEFIQSLKEPPPSVEMPRFFAGCLSKDEAIVRTINELGKPFAVERDGLDEFYKRISNALILILANQGNIVP